MTDTTQASPAGEAVTATMQEPMTVEAAAGLLAGWDDEDEGSTPAAEAAPEQPQADIAEPEEPEAAAADAGDDGEGEEAEGEEGAQGYDWDKVPGDAKFRLRDGRIVTAADLKRDFDRLSAVSDAEQRIQQEYAQFQQQQAAIQNQAQQFAQLAPQALQAIQASLPQVPPMPDQALAQSDPIRYVEELAAHNQARSLYEAKVGQMRQIQAAAAQQQQRMSAEQQQRLSQYIDTQRDQLLAAMPHLREPAKRQEFYRDFLDTGAKAYGFSEQELNAVYDARLMKMAADAIAYRKLMSKGKPAPVPAQPASAPRAPVAQPGRRVTTNESKAAQRSQLFQQFRANGGDLRDAAAVVAAMDD